MSDKAIKVFEVQFSWAWLHPRHWGEWLVGGLLLLLAFIPAKIRDRFAVFVADRIFNLKALRKRREIADLNLKLCFPDWSEKQREQLMRENVRILAQLMLGVGELSVRSRQHLLKRIEVDGLEHLEFTKDKDQRFIVLLPHTYPVDYAGLYFSALGIPLCTMFKKSRSEITDWIMTKQRTRYGGLLIERDMGIKALIKTIRAGHSCIYLPDEDFGPEQSLMTPMFATKKATLPVLGKLSKLTNSVIVPIYAGYDSTKHKVKLFVHPPLEGYPSGDVAADTLEMNKQVEQLILRSPEQYMWTLKLFRTVEGQDQPRY